MTEEKYDKMTLEELLARLDDILNVLDNEELPLEKAVELFSEGSKITKIAQKKINDLQERVKIIKENLETGEFREDIWGENAE